MRRKERRHCLDVREVVEALGRSSTLPLPLQDGQPQDNPVSAEANVGADSSTDAVMPDDDEEEQPIGHFEQIAGTPVALGRVEEAAVTPSRDSDEEEAPMGRCS